jgi:hypothetical protein
MRHSRQLIKQKIIVYSKHSEFKTLLALSLLVSEWNSISGFCAACRALYVRYAHFHTASSTRGGGFKSFMNRRWPRRQRPSRLAVESRPDHSVRRAGGVEDTTRRSRCTYALAHLR